MSDTTGPVTRKIVSAFDLSFPEIDHAEDKVWGRLVTDLPGDQARLLPRAMAEALPIVASLLPPDRLIIGIRLTVALDIVECVGVLSFLSEDRNDIDAAIGAAALASNPSVAEGLVERVATLTTLGAMSARQRAIFETMLTGSASVETPRSRAVKRGRWPGLDEHAPNQPLVIVEETSATPTAAMWLLIGELQAAGAVVRRVFPDATRTSPPGFVHPRHISLGWNPHSSLPSLSDSYLQLPAELFHPGAMREALDLIAQRVLARQGLEIDLAGAPRFCSDQREAAPQSLGATSSFAARRQMTRVRQGAYEAVMSYVADELHIGSVQFSMLLDVGEQVASGPNMQFNDVLSSALTPLSEDYLASAARDGVRAAVAELLKQKLLRYEPPGSAVLQRIP